MKIIIDGISGVGKSAVAHEISKRNNMYHISMGTIFRALAWCKISKKEYDSNNLEILFSKGEYPKVFFGKKDITANLYEESIEEEVTTISGDSTYQEYAYSLVKKNSYDNAVIEGRNARRFFSDACPIFLYADKEKRNQRKQAIGQKNEKHGGNDRDAQDVDRKVGTVFVDKNYYLYDSSENTIEETVQEIEEIVGLKTAYSKKASVVTTVFGEKRIIDDFIDALTRQTLKNDDYEVILVTDKENAINDERVKNIVCDNLKEKGLAYARNIGIANAIGEVVIFLDADMIVNEDFIISHLKYHAHTNNAIVLGARKHLLEGEKIGTLSSKIKKESRDVLLRLYSEDVGYFLNPWAICYGCNISIRKKNLEGIIFDSEFSGWGIEDIEWAYRQVKHGLHVIYAQEAFGYHKYHNREKTENRYVGWKNNLRLFAQKHCEKDARSFQIFSSVFDPDILADYMEIFDLFNKTYRKNNLKIFFLEGNENETLYKMQRILCKESNADILFVVDQNSLFYINTFSKYLHDIGKNTFMVFRRETFEEENYLKDMYIKISCEGEPSFL